MPLRTRHLSPYPCFYTHTHGHFIPHSAIHHTHPTPFTPIPTSIHLFIPTIPPLHTSRKTHPHCTSYTHSVLRLLLLHLSHTLSSQVSYLSLFLLFFVISIFSVSVSVSIPCSASPSLRLISPLSNLSLFPAFHNPHNLSVSLFLSSCLCLCSSFRVSFL